MSREEGALVRAPYQMEGWGAKPVEPRLGGSGSVSLLGMTDAERRRAGKRKRERERFGFNLPPEPKA